MTKNIDLSTNGFPATLSRLRQAAQLTKSELAEKSGLTYRTVHDLENGKRRRAQEKTLLMLAQALDVTLPELVCPDPGDTELRAAPPRSRHLRLLGLIVVIALLLTGVTVWNQSNATAEWTLKNGGLEVRNSLTKTRLWSIDPAADQVQFCRISPWNSRYLLVGTNRRAEGGGSLLCLERATGDTAWTVKPDLDALLKAFGREDVMAAQFSCSPASTVANLDGDDTPEFVTGFMHGKYYPFAICIVEADGSVRGQYSHKGHLNTFLVTDLDQDGKDEVVVTGVTNTKAYMGATVLLLDGTHCSGASMDSLCVPYSDVPDSALVRLIIPNYPQPYMDQMHALRLSSRFPQLCRDGAGNEMISIVIYGDVPKDALTVFLTPELRPIRAELDDAFRQNALVDWPDSLTNGTGPGDPDWLADWLAGYKRFSMGQLLPD